MRFRQTKQRIKTLFQYFRFQIHNGENITLYALWLIGSGVSFGVSVFWWQYFIFAFLTLLLPMVWILFVYPSIWDIRNDYRMFKEKFCR